MYLEDKSQSIVCHFLCKKGVLLGMRSGEQPTTSIDASAEPHGPTDKSPYHWGKNIQVV
jgi:hypothetical protein